VITTGMLFHFNLKSSWLLVFSLHILLLAILLFLKGVRKKDSASCWLGFFSLLTVLNIAPFMLGYAGWYANQPYRNILFYLPLQHLFLLPPVLYLYCLYLLDSSFVFTRKSLLHFVPAFVYLLYSIIMAVSDGWLTDKPFFYQDGRDRDFDISYQIAGFLSLLVYLIASLRLYHRYRIINADTNSHADTMLFPWVQRFLLACLGLLLLRILFFVINPEWGEFGKKFWYYLLFSLLVYYISFSGYINSIRSQISLSEKDLLPLAAALQESQPDEKLITAESMPDPELLVWKQKLEALMTEEHLYENPELTVFDLAGRLSVPPKLISRIINQGFGKNFNDYINSHRVQAVIRLLEEGVHGEQTLPSIAYECGFNSKPTFNRAFKKHTGRTPVDFIREQL
jgi:AraC-like DNA-binding protein